MLGARVIGILVILCYWILTYNGIFIPKLYNLVLLTVFIVKDKVHFNLSSKLSHAFYCLRCKA